MAKRTEIKMTFEDKGIKKELTRIVKDFPKVENKALREGVAYFANKLEEATPVGPYRADDKYGPNTNYSPVHMKDDVKWQKFGEGTYIAGFGVDTAWRAVFVNNGTIHMSANPFFDKVVDRELDNVNQKISDIVRRELF